jgi:hypothetical protein
MMATRALMFGRAMIVKNSRRLPWILIVLLAGGADEYRPTPKFEGKAIPDPPRQRAAWTPPETKLPKFLVTATAALCDAGMADPRDCEYREVEIGDGVLVKTRGFVLPEQPGVLGRFAVSWDGIVYPAVTIGAPADLEADTRSLADELKTGPPAAANVRSPARSGGFANRGHLLELGGMVRGPATVESRSPLQLILLLRVGRADLAEKVFAAGTTWTPELSGRDLTDYHITFLTLASEWAEIQYSRLLSAHQRGEDVIALDAACQLTAFQKAVEARATNMGFPRPARRNSSQPEPVPYVGRFEQLDVLLADQERRAKEPPRGPIPERGGDPSARIAALIRDFDQIHVQQISVPGSSDPGSAPVVRELIAEGDPAVEPLLAALVSDTRLTRSVTGGRGPSYVHPVTDAIYGALRGILKTNSFLEENGDFTAVRMPDGRKQLAAAIRAFWEKNRGMPLVERWFRTLNDDAAGTDRWLEAAAGMIQPVTYDTPPTRYVSYGPWTGTGPAPAMKGEALRDRRDPSISDLMARRAADIARTDNPAALPDIGLIRACELAQMFARWDMKAALPTLKTLMTASIERSRDTRGGETDRGYARFVAEFTMQRARAGDLGALDEYAAWVRNVTPRMIEGTRLKALEPLWTYPDRPALVTAARTMFLDPKSPWLPLVPRDRNRAAAFSPFDIPISSPLVCVPAFREALLAALEDKATVGSAQLQAHGQVHITMASGVSGGFGASRVPGPDDREGVEVSFRACDYVANALSTLEGAPECQLYWTETHRDAALTACAAYLRRCGSHFSPEPLPGQNDFPQARAHLRFPKLDHPATAQNVREARAIFTLEGEGEARVVSLPQAFPIFARWTTLKEFPIDQMLGNREFRRDYLRDGWVWQAEEVTKDGHTDRYYGFVGHATIARVPAPEIVFPGDRYRSVSLPDALDVELRLADQPQAMRAGFEPGRPIVVAMSLRNGQGVERSVPTEFLRPADDGKPALRRGVSLELFAVPRVAPGSQGLPAPAPAELLTPTRTAHFDPGDAARSLAPTESLQVLTLDLNDWYAGLKPGPYRLHLKFTADSGLAEGTSNDVFFVIGPGDEVVP